MTFKEYGTVIEPAKKQGQFKEFGEVIEPMSRIQSLAHAPIKGAIKRAGGLAGTAQAIAPFLPKGELTPESAERFAEEKFPTFEREPEKILERAGGLGLESLLTPGGPVAKGIQTAVGTGLGYAAEKLGAPEWAQAIAEGVPFLFSGGKKIPLKANQKKLGEFMRKEGLSENEIATMLKTPEQIKRWSGWAAKGKKSRELMESIYSKTGKIYDTITEEAAQLPNGYVGKEAGVKFLTELTDIVKDMPHKYRQLIQQDAKDLLQAGGHFNDFTNFYHDLNAVIAGERGGKAIVGRFKGPVLGALESINPKLADDFRLTNDLFRTRAQVKGALISPQDFDKFLDLGEGLALGQAVFNRDMGMMAKVISVAGARTLAREMLINPRLQNISVRVGEALKNNKYLLAEKLMSQFKDEAKESNPELEQYLH